MEYPRTIIIFVILLMSAGVSTQANPTYFEGTFDFSSSGFQDQLITAGPDVNTSNAGVSILPTESTGSNLTLVIIYNETKSVEDSPNKYHNRTDVFIKQHIEQFESLYPNSPGYSFAYPFEDELGGSDTNTDDPLKFRLVIYHETNEPASIFIKVSLDTEIYILDSMNSSNDDLPVSGVLYLILIIFPLKRIFSPKK